MTASDCHSAPILLRLRRSSQPAVTPPPVTIAEPSCRSYQQLSLLRNRMPNRDSNALSSRPASGVFFRGPHCFVGAAIFCLLLSGRSETRASELGYLEARSQKLAATS